MNQGGNTAPPAIRPAHWIMLGLLVWGGYLAIGAVRFGGTLALWRGLIVFACTLVFLGFWWLALLVRERSIHSQDES
jgi:hypothetical protein